MDDTKPLIVRFSHENCQTSLDETFNPLYINFKAVFDCHLKFKKELSCNMMI